MGPTAAAITRDPVVGPPRRVRTMTSSSRFCWYFAACLLALVPACRDRVVEQTARPLRVVASGDTAGWIVPCGCTSNQSGGLLRRGTYIKQLRAVNEVVYVDTGGAPGGTSPYDVAKFEAIIQGEMALQIAAHNIGAGEAQLGSDQLRSIQRASGIPWLSCNVRDRQGKLLGAPVIMTDTSRGRLALLGVLSDSEQLDELQVDPPRESILQVLAELPERPDAIVVLAYLPKAELESLAASIPEVDAVLGGPTMQSIVPQSVGPTLLASATSKGKYLAELSAPDRLRGGRWAGTIVEMDEHFADDVRQQENLRQFYGELRKRDFSASQTSFAATLFASTAQSPENFLVAGTERCRECHLDDCLLWDKSKHAEAWHTLAATGSEVDPYCQQCHTTSYGIPGGFVSAARSRDRYDVGCESCHGASYAHCEDSDVHTPFFRRASDQCVHCHDRENSPKFAYDAYWAKITHGTEQQDADGQSTSRFAAPSNGAD